MFASRNARRELNDIRFEFITGKDTAEGIATELVGAGLVDPHDSVPISMNLTKLLDNQFITASTSKTITFLLVSRPLRNKMLISTYMILLVMFHYKPTPQSEGIHCE